MKALNHPTWILMCCIPMCLRYVLITKPQRRKESEMKEKKIIDLLSLLFVYRINWDFFPSRERDVSSLVFQSFLCFVFVEEIYQGWMGFIPFLLLIGDRCWICKFIFPPTEKQRWDPRKFFSLTHHQIEEFYAIIIKIISMRSNEVWSVLKLKLINISLDRKKII